MLLWEDLRPATQSFKKEKRRKKKKKKRKKERKKENQPYKSFRSNKYTVAVNACFL